MNTCWAGHSVKNVLLPLSIEVFHVYFHISADLFSKRHGLLETKEKVIKVVFSVKM